MPAPDGFYYTLYRHGCQEPGAKWFFLCQVCYSLCTVNYAPGSLPRINYNRLHAHIVRRRCHVWSFTTAHRVKLATKKPRRGAGVGIRVLDAKKPRPWDGRGLREDYSVFGSNMGTGEPVSRSIRCSRKCRRRSGPRTSRSSASPRLAGCSNDARKTDRAPRKYG